MTSEMDSDNPKGYVDSTLFDLKVSEIMKSVECFEPVWECDGTSRCFITVMLREVSEWWDLRSR